MSTLSVTFNCIICKNLPNNVSKLFHCQNGHLVCDKCVPESSQCNSCNRPLKSCPLAWNFFDSFQVKYPFHYPGSGGKIVEVPSEDLNCVKCSKTPVKPIYKCSNGHLLCGSCYSYDQIGYCLKCWENGMSRCEFADKWLKPTDGDLTPCSGFYETCRCTITEKDAYYNYLRTVHLIPEKAVENGIFMDTLMWFRFDPPTTFYKVKFNGETFLINRAVENDIFSFWISMNKDEEIGNKYEFELTLQKLNRTGAADDPEVTRTLCVIPLKSQSIQAHSQKKVIEIPYKDIIHLFQPTNAEHPVTKFKSESACSLKYKIIKI